MFKYEGNIEQVRDAAKKANDLLNNDNFINSIKAKSHFDMATCNGLRIVQNINFHKNAPLSVIVVKTYKSKNPFSSAYGYFSPSKPDHVFLNTRKLNRSIGSITSSLIHEMIHYLDYKDPIHSFGHGENDPIGKNNTAPYWIDNVAQAIIDDKKPEFKNLENSKIYTPLLIRVWIKIKELINGN